MTPGATELTRIPNSAHSTASVLVRFSTPARAAPVCAIMGNPLRTSAVILTMHPPLLLMPPWLCAPALIRKAPSRFVRSTARHPLGVIVSARAGNWPPPLLTRRSTDPSLAVTSL
eukprot:Amastigsp_a678235_11.p3 type:complete len:115 gc:universal Amastigsp_a678235_11:278-622(+)